MWHIILVLFFVSVMVKNELFRRAREMDDIFRQLGVTPYPRVQDHVETSSGMLQQRQNISGYFRMKFEFEVLPIQRPGEYRVSSDDIFSIE